MTHGALEPPPPEPPEVACEAGLRYVADDEPGLRVLRSPWSW